VCPFFEEVPYLAVIECRLQLAFRGGQVILDTYCTPAQTLSAKEAFRANETRHWALVRYDVKLSRVLRSSTVDYITLL